TNWPSEPGGWGRSPRPARAVTTTGITRGEEVDSDEGADAAFWLYRLWRDRGRHRRCDAGGEERDGNDCHGYQAGTRRVAGRAPAGCRDYRDNRRTAPPGSGRRLHRHPAPPPRPAGHPGGGGGQARSGRETADHFRCGWPADDRRLPARGRPAERLLCDALYARHSGGPPTRARGRYRQGDRLLHPRGVQKEGELLGGRLFGPRADRLAAVLADERRRYPEHQYHAQ